MTEGQYHLLNVLRWLARQLIDGEDQLTSSLAREIDLDRVDHLATKILENTRKFADPESDPGEAAAYFDAFNLAGRVKLLKRDLKSAEGILKEGLAFAEDAKHSPPNLSVAEVKQNLGTVYDLENREEEALELFKEALDVMERNHPVPLETVANLSNNLGLIYRNQEDYESAEEHYLRALEVFTEMEEHPVEVALVCNNLGTLYWAANELDESKVHHNKALDLRRKHLESAHPDVAQSASNLAVVHHQAGEFDHAEVLYEEAFELLRKIEPVESDLLDVVSQNYAALLEQNENPRKAAKILGVTKKLIENNP